MNLLIHQTYCGIVILCTSNLEISNTFYKIVKTAKTNTKRKTNKRNKTNLIYCPRGPSPPPPMVQAHLAQKPPFPYPCLLTPGVAHIVHCHGDTSQTYL